MNEIEKSLHFNDSHNISTKQPMGVMAVSEARKLIKEAKKEERERIFGKIIEWDSSGEMWEDIINFINHDKSEKGDKK